MDIKCYFFHSSRNIFIISMGPHQGPTKATPLQPGQVATTQDDTTRWKLTGQQSLGEGMHVTIFTSSAFPNETARYKTRYKDVMHSTGRELLFYNNFRWTNICKILNHYAVDLKLI